MISNCTISNTEGIYIDSSDSNIIRDSEIKGGGIEIKDSSSNIITYCNIHGNGYGNGITIREDSDRNSITNCSIYDKNYGVSITDTNANYNEIYHNNFRNYINNAHNARDKVGNNNKWHNSYPSGGNLWDDYDEESEGAKDYYKGLQQTTQGIDGIADEPYTKNYVNDRYPFCRRNPTMPYFIDYWNPYGDSVILVNTSIGAFTSKYIYLYYRYSGTLNNLHKHNMSEISLFFDDFYSGDLLNKQWDLPQQPNKYKLQDSCINLLDGVNISISTKYFSIPNIGDPPKNALSSTTNESMYIVEAKMKINKGQGNIILLEKVPTGTMIKTYYYLISANLTPSNRLSLHKWSYLSTWPNPTIECYELDNVSAPNLSHWVRMKSYVYLSKTHYPYPADPSKHSQTNATFIKNYVYDFNTFADLSSVSGLDTYGYSSVADPPWTGEPDDEAARRRPYPLLGDDGRIGLGCGLLSSQNSNISVDWIRVMKSPVVPPIVTVGSMESINYGWTTNSQKAWNANTFNQFEPGPVLCDFNYGRSSTTFVIKNLPADIYTITITKGNYTNTTSITRVTACGQTLTIPATECGEFETKWFTITKGAGDLTIGFSAGGGTSGETAGPPGGGDENKWSVNSLIIDRGAKGVKVGLE
jgi:hypothetical protein